jgi:hypothetical protein
MYPRVSVQVGGLRGKQTSLKLNACTVYGKAGYPRPRYDFISLASDRASSGCSKELGRLYMVFSMVDDTGIFHKLGLIRWMRHVNIAAKRSARTPGKSATYLLAYLCTCTAT